MNIKTCVYGRLLLLLTNERECFICLIFQSIEHSKKNKRKMLVLRVLLKKKESVFENFFLN